MLKDKIKKKTILKKDLKIFLSKFSYLTQTQCIHSILVKLYKNIFLGFSLTLSYDGTNKFNSMVENQYIYIYIYIYNLPTDILTHRTMV
jgi:hypothetical protein